MSGKKYNIKPHRALTRIALYYKKPFKGTFKEYHYSYDLEADISSNNPEAGMDRLYKIFIAPAIGFLATALIYPNTPGKAAPLRKYDQNGNRII